MTHVYPTEAPKSELRGKVDRKQLPDPWESMEGDNATDADKARSGPWWYPLVMTNIANWKMALEIVDFPINSMVDLSIAMLVYQRVNV